MEDKEKYEIEVSSDKLITIAEIAEKRALAVKKIKQQALRLTNEGDWVDQGGRPYLQSSGAEKIARLFGISWRFIGEPQKFVEEDGHFRYEVSMEFILGDSAIEVRGSRSSKDPFFTTRYKTLPDGKKEKIEIPPSEIDAGDVLKSAITNSIANGITRILGIRNLTWEDLKEGGIDISKITKVEYKHTQKLSEKPSEKPPEKATQKQIFAIQTLLSKLEIQDEYERHEKVSEILNYDKVIESLKLLTFEEASKVIKTLNEELNSRKEIEND